MATLGDLGRDPVASHCRHSLTQTPCMALGGPVPSLNELGTSRMPRAGAMPFGDEEWTACIRACVRVCVLAAVSEALNVFAPAPLHRCH